MTVLAPANRGQDNVTALALECRCVSRTTQHLVDFVLVQFLVDDHFARVFLEQHLMAFCDLQQVVVGGQGALLVLHALAQDVADVVLLGFQ